MTSQHLGDKSHREGDFLFHFEIFEESSLIVLEIHTRLPTFETSPADDATALVKIAKLTGSTKEESLRKAISWCRDWVKSKSSK